MKADFLIVGAGFCGTTVAERLASTGIKVLVVEKRNHVSGNSFSIKDSETGIDCHEYGSHVFHTSNQKVWNYLNKFTNFNNYQHTVWTTVRNRVYSLPINLSTINSFYEINLKPCEVNKFLDKERSKRNFKPPVNLEEKAISLVGLTLYQAFIKGYTIKQWQKDPKELSPEIISRLPVRNNYVNRYFNDKYEGIPLDGYGIIFERMLDHKNIELRLNTDYFNIKNELYSLPKLFTGPIDRFFDYEFGRMEWLSLVFKKEVHSIPDYQGCPVMNFADLEVPYTRIHEFKHFHPERKFSRKTLIYKEFSKIAELNDDLYYPVLTHKNIETLKKYQMLSKSIDKTWFGGRLGGFKYLDMDDAIAEGLELAETIIKVL